MQELLANMTTENAYNKEVLCLNYILHQVYHILLQYTTKTFYILSKKY